MEPIDKILIRIGIIILGGLLGKNVITTNEIHEIAKNWPSQNRQVTQNAGIVPLPPKK